MHSNSRSSSSLLRLCTGLALVAAPTLLGARGCELEPTPVACPDLYAPVCGTDGVTYSNACEADAAGVDVAHEGTCETTACPEIYAPVCGVDGATYSNDCFAAAAGVPVAHEGACSCAPVTCDLYCEHGFAIDPTTGCESCTCNAGTECASDLDCASNEQCLLPACAAICIDDDADGECDPIDCGPGVCAPREEPPAGCTSDADCGADAYCEIVGCAECGDGSLPSECSGYCRPRAPEGCTSDADCGPGAVCALSDCGPEADCGGGGSCIPVACTSDADCGPGATCTVCPPTADCAYDAWCTPTEPPPPVGCDSDVACGEGSHCESVVCAAVCPEDGSECIWTCPGGECVPDATTCTSDADCAPSQLCSIPEIACDPSGEPCPDVVGVCTDRPEEPPTPANCTSDAECPSGQYCSIPMIECFAEPCPDPIGICEAIPVIAI